ncbi:MAG TPA: polyhydroxyalkanoate synthesis repressor PhaR [Arenimonas sp.]|nr:polyhydroxyalkanoate synthesis repressor PhaR [Arenimonas sp.]
MPIVRIIKKYPNRRLYDTEISSYITLEDVRQLLVEEHAFVVRDAKTGADLTRSVLLQIIAEHEEQGTPMLSTALLGQLVRFYGDPLQATMGSYLQRCVEEFAAQQPMLRRELGSNAAQSPWNLLNQITARDSGSGKPSPASSIGSGVEPGKPR